MLLLVPDRYGVRPCGRKCHRLPVLRYCASDRVHGGRLAIHSPGLGDFQGERIDKLVGAGEYSTGCWVITGKPSRVLLAVVFECERIEDWLALRVDPLEREHHHATAAIFICPHLAFRCRAGGGGSGNVECPLANRRIVVRLGGKSRGHAEQKHESLQSGMGQYTPVRVADCSSRSCRRTA